MAQVYVPSARGQYNAAKRPSLKNLYHDDSKKPINYYPQHYGNNITFQPSEQTPNNAPQYPGQHDNISIMNRQPAVQSQLSPQQQNYQLEHVFDRQDRQRKFNQKPPSRERKEYMMHIDRMDQQARENQYPVRYQKSLDFESPANAPKFIQPRQQAPQGQSNIAFNDGYKGQIYERKY